MKKLLLLSLFCMGMSAFGAIQGTETDVSLPIRARGEVIAASGDNLVIKATTNGMDAREMQFDFGIIAAGTKSKTLAGTFEVAKAGNSAFAGEASSGSNNISIGLDSGATVKSDVTKFDSNKVEFQYALTGKLTEDKTKYMGTVEATFIAKSGATAEVYTDNTKAIYVKKHTV